MSKPAPKIPASLEKMIIYNKVTDIILHGWKLWKLRHKKITGNLGEGRGEIVVRGWVASFISKLMMSPARGSVV